MPPPVSLAGITSRIVLSSVSKGQNYTILVEGPLWNSETLLFIKIMWNYISSPIPSTKHGQFIWITYYFFQICSKNINHLHIHTYSKASIKHNVMPWNHIRIHFIYVLKPRFSAAAHLWPLRFSLQGSTQSACMRLWGLISAPLTWITGSQLKGLCGGASWMTLQTGLYIRFWMW